MVHKQYKKKNGKLIGPYYYESYREDGKVKKRYIGKKLSVGLKLSKEIASVLILGFFLLALVFLTGFAGGAAGDVHVSYYIGLASGDQRYCNNTAGAWSCTDVETTNDVGQYNSIFLDSNNVAHVSIFDNTNKDLRYCNNTAGAWSCTAVDVSNIVGLYNSLVTDSSNNVHISHRDNTNADLRYCNNTAGEWSCTAVDTSDDVGQYTSIALDSNDKIHISEYDFTGGDLRYCNNTAGAWSCTDVETTNDVGLENSIAIDSNDVVHISHYDNTNADLRYCNNTAGAWSCVAVDTTSTVGHYSSLAIDSSAVVHISEYVTGGDLGYCNNTGGAWSCTTVVTDDDVGSYSSLAIDSSDVIHITHYNVTGGNVGYCNNTAGAWSCTEIVATIGPNMLEGNHIFIEGQTSRNNLATPFRGNGNANSSSLDNTEWRMFGRYLNHSSYVNSTVTGNISLTDVREYVTGENPRAIPVIANGYLYVGGNGNTFYQLNATNVSHFIANHTAPGVNADISSTAAVAGEYVYVGSDNNQFYQLNATNVSLLAANYTLPGAVNFASPTVSEGYVYMIAGNANTVGQAYQFNATNITEVIANRTLYKSAGSATPNSFVVNGNNAYIGFRNGTDSLIQQLNASNISKVLNTFTVVGSNAISEMSLKGDSIYGYVGDAFYQLNSSNVTKIINSVPYTSPGKQIPAIRGDYVYVIGGSFINQLNATNISLSISNFSSSGTITGAYGFAVNDDYLFASGSSGSIIQFNSTNLSVGPITSYTLGGGSLESSPIIAGGSVFIGSDNSRFYSFGNYSNADVTSPITTINFPANVTYNATSFNFNVSLNENGTAWFTINGATTNFTLLNSEDHVSIFGTVFNYTNASMIDGGYNFTAYGNDTAGNRAAAESVNFGVDTGNPGVTINLPTSSTKTTNSFGINITLSEKGSCVYSINGGSVNTSLTDRGDGKGFTGTRTSVPNAAYTLSAYCEDLIGNRNYTETVGFTVSVSSGSGDSGGSSGGSSGGGAIATPSSDQDVNTGEGTDCNVVSCEAWSECDPLTKKKTRSCSLSGNSCSDSEKTNGVEQMMSCGLEVCIADWQCGDWIFTGDEVVKRKCVDANSCKLKRSLGVAL